MLTFYLSLASNEADKQKIELIYNEYKSFMMAISMKVLKNPQLASESVQDSIIKLIKKIDTIDDVFSERTKAFIYIVTVNTAKTKLKSEKKHVSADFDIAEKITVSTKDCFESVFLNEVLDAIIKLPSIYREPLELYAYYELSTKEIASIIGISESLVKKRIALARKELREIFKKEGTVI